MSTETREFDPAKEVSHCRHKHHKLRVQSYRVRPTEEGWEISCKVHGPGSQCRLMTFDDNGSCWIDGQGQYQLVNVPDYPEKCPLTGRPLCPKCNTAEGVHGGCNCGFLSAWKPDAPAPTPVDWELPLYITESNAPCKRVYRSDIRKAFANLIVTEDSSEGECQAWANDKGVLETGYHIGNTPPEPQVLQTEVACAVKDGEMYLARRSSENEIVVIYHWRGIESDIKPQKIQEQCGYVFGEWQTIELPQPSGIPG